MAIIGNRSGHVFGMARQVLAHPEFELVAAAEDHAPALAELRQLGDFAYYSDYRKMLDAEKIDGVIVCTANNRKAEAIASALERNIHVLADKPLATTFDGLEAMERALAKSSGTLYPWFTMRFNHYFFSARKLVNDGDLGQVINCFVQGPHKMRVEAAKSWLLDEEQNGGVLLDIGCHKVDLVRWFTGSEVTEVTAYHSNMKFPDLKDFHDNGTMLLEMRDGSTALIRTDWLTPLAAEYFMDYFLSLTGSKGALEVRDGADKLVRYSSDTIGTTAVAPTPPPHDMIQDFLNSASGRAPVILTPKDALEATRVTLFARESARNRRTMRVR